ncbi:hypothetical protein JY651_44645 [Pyxidicoccus parkwayensis]|uniref:Uncharacterized protein n=1 Tax=Pyxidicoccus parkwayensis TaxID=2813578 RepID=A0ABX7NXF7_9BACT|nr:hypothetical protein [Pyxidicoccus parkwaysis]QSQ22150.1 hypothetical protein JY651_44645 [Pyxidicoccus parkwaysis]
MSADRKSARMRAESALLGNGRVYTFVRGDGRRRQRRHRHVSRPRPGAARPAGHSGPVFCHGTGCPQGTTDHGLLRPG